MTESPMSSSRDRPSTLRTLQQRGQRRLQGINARWRGWPGYLWRAWRQYQRHGGATFAAALAYHIFFSIFPLLLLLTALGGRLLADQALEETLALTLRQLLPGTWELVYRTVADLREQWQVASLIGALSLFWSASAMFKVMITALDRIFQVRSGYLRILVAIGLVLIVALLFILAAGLSATTGLLQRLAPVLQEPLPPLDLVSLSVHFLSLFIAILAFLIVYKFLPSCKVLWRAAIAAAVPVGIIWKVAQQLFTVYITQYARFNLVYGPLTAVVALLFWAYISSSIFLLGVELVAVLNVPPAPPGAEELDDLCRPA